MLGGGRCRRSTDGDAQEVPFRAGQSGRGGELRLSEKPQVRLGLFDAAALGAVRAQGLAVRYPCSTA